MPLITDGSLQETDIARNHANSLHKANPAMRGVDPDKIRPTEYQVFMYSVSKRKMADPRIAFVVEHALFRQIRIPTCGPDQRFVKFMAIDHPVQQPHMDPHSPDEATVYISDARRVALSICNPDMVGTTMDNAGRDNIASNCDLIRQGVFFSLHDSDKDFKKFEPALIQAEQRRDNYYDTLLKGIEGMSREELRRVLNSDQGTDYRAAAEHFGVEYEWNVKRVAKVACPNCGEKISQGIAFHKSAELGIICVLDWKRAVAAGVKTKADVPEELRWFTEGKK